MSQQSHADREPAPSTTEEILQRAHTAALIQVLGPKKGFKFLRAIVAELTANAEPSAVHPIRRSAAFLETRRQNAEAALNAFRRDLPHFCDLAQGQRR